MLSINAGVDPAELSFLQVNIILLVAPATPVNVYVVVEHIALFEMVPNNTLLAFAVIRFPAVGAKVFIQDQICK
jgi:hypothetical protein